MSAPLPDLPYRLTETRAPQVGLIILQSDESIERDFRRMLPHGLALMIGPGRVAELIRAGIATPEVTEPVSALIAACAHLGIGRLAILSPYIADVSARLRTVLAGAGVATTGFGSFNVAEEARVMRIAPKSIVEAGCAVAGMSVAALGAAGYWLGRARALHLTGGSPAALHSLPGWQIATVCSCPAPTCARSM